MTAHILALSSSERNSSERNGYGWLTRGLSNSPTIGALQPDFHSDFHTDRACFALAIRASCNILVCLAKLPLPRPERQDNDQDCRAFVNGMYAR